MGRKSSVITLTPEEREYLETQTRARTIQAQTVSRARILLLKADGCSINEIADKVGLNRKSEMLCISKYSEGVSKTPSLMLPVVDGMQKLPMMKKLGSSTSPARNRLILVMPLKHGHMPD